MDIWEAASLSLVMLILALIPSTSVALVVTRSITHGLFSGIAVSLGIVIGDLIFILSAILGLSVIAETMGWLFLTIKYIGAIYLIWFGYKLLISKSTEKVFGEDKKLKGNLVTSFLAGLFLTLGDIKAVFFYISLFPTFVNLESLIFNDVLIVIFVTIITVGGAKVFYVLSANKLISISKTYNLESKVKKLAGGLMLGTGSYLIVKA